jgi:hypothetical protein
MKAFSSSKLLNSGYQAGALMAFFKPRFGQGPALLPEKITPSA